CGARPRQEARALESADLRRRRDGGEAAEAGSRVASSPVGRLDLMTSSAISSRPLAGIKVLELGQLIAGPFAGKVFAEFGAEVIKVEPPSSDNAPGGDPLRQWRLLHEGTSLWWYVQARNKKSITVDLRKAEGQEIVRRLAHDPDFII